MNHNARNISKQSCLFAFLSFPTCINNKVTLILLIQRYLRFFFFLLSIKFLNLVNKNFMPRSTVIIINEIKRKKIERILSTNSKIKDLSYSFTKITKHAVTDLKKKKKNKIAS